MSEHTPTPLVFYSGSHSIYDAAGKCLCVVKGRQTVDAPHGALERGLHIVRCVNAWDDAPALRARLTELEAA